MSVTAPNAETPTSAKPPDTFATPPVMSLACDFKVSSESLPPLTKPPRSLCRASQDQHYHDGEDDDADDQHGRAGRPAPRQLPFHQVDHWGEDCGGEDRDEDQQQDVTD